MIATITEARACGGAAIVKSACRTLSLPRSIWYRRQKLAQTPDPDIELRDHIQRLALVRSVYGYRRMTRELHREGIFVNHKRVLRIMRADNLLCLRKRRFIRTTDSDHGLLVYPNLAKDLKVDAVDRLWVSDITYIRLQGEFVYLAVVLDAYSRRVIGWQLSRRIDTELTLAALEDALACRNARPGLIHHSDRGVQYAATEYTQMLKDNGIAISMSRRGNPYDNAQAESFMKTLKYEEVYLSDYANLSEAQQSIGYFLNQVYNRERLHSKLGYVPPEEFEDQILRQSTDHLLTSCPI